MDSGLSPLIDQHCLKSFFFLSGKSLFYFLHFTSFEIVRVIAYETEAHPSARSLTRAMRYCQTYVLTFKKSTHRGVTVRFRTWVPCLEWLPNPPPCVVAVCRRTFGPLPFLRSWLFARRHKDMETWTHVMHFKWEVTWTHGTQSNIFHLRQAGE